MLQKHLETPEENRDQAWDERFFKLFSETTLNIISEEPQQGPDGWPYLLTKTIAEENLSLSSSSDSAQKIIHWLSSKGIGLVVNPQRTPYPDYVFSYGMIWSFKETGWFIKYSDISKQSEFVLDKQNPDIIIGKPTEQYLPTYVRSVLKDFFRDQSVFDARIVLISTDGKNYDLCFSLESLGNPPDSEHQDILEALSWFLPPHYSLAVISEKGIQGFESL